MLPRHLRRPQRLPRFRPTLPRIAEFPLDWFVICHFWRILALRLLRRAGRGPYHGHVTMRMVAEAYRDGLLLSSDDEEEEDDDDDL